MNQQHAVGDEVEVLLSQPFDWQRRQQPDPIWTPGFRIAAVVGAADREYRLDVEGPETYRGCAPECVRRLVQP